MKIQFIDAAPNAGAISYIAKKVAATIKAQFKAPISRKYNRVHGYDFQLYETLPDGMIGLYFDGGKVCLVKTKRENGPGSTYLEILKELSPQDLDEIITKEAF